MAKKNTSRSVESPLFRQIVDELKATIVGGKLAEHTALPSERVIAEHHNVSRMTARRALEAVEAEGLAYSIDRKGRFVSPKRLDYDVTSMANFISSAADKGIEIEMELLDSQGRQAGQKLAAILSVPTNTLVYENTRLFRRDGHTAFLEIETVIADRCADLLIKTTPQQLQEHRYSPLGHTADIVIRMHALNPNEAKHLGLMPYQAAIEQEQLVRDQSGAPLCFCRQIWRGELAQFSAQALIK
jgi:GntR family transcriptional regulator